MAKSAQSFLQGWMKGWMTARLPREDQVTLGQRRVYILPTRTGLAFGVAMLVMLLASLNYNLSLGFLLTFLLAGSSVVAIHHTHNTLRGLQIRCGAQQHNFAGSTAQLALALHNPSRQDRYAIELALHHTDPAFQLSESCVDLLAGQSQTVQLFAQHPRRGYLACPRLVLSTRYPLGLWRCWAYFTPAPDLLFYPALDALTPPWQASQGHAADASAQAPRPEPSSQAAERDLGGVRAYQVGDIPRDFAWRAYARSQQPATKLYDPVADHVSPEQPWQLDFAALPAHLSTESKLSRLATWITQAQRTQHPFTLSLPQQTTLAGTDAGHVERCLRALALYGLPAAPASSQRGRS